jgi:hypothetical protein
LINNIRRRTLLVETCIGKDPGKRGFFKDSISAMADLTNSNESLREAPPTQSAVPFWTKNVR